MPNITPRETVQRLQQFSVPLLAGVVVALALANTNYRLYDQLVHAPVYEIPAILVGREHARQEHAPAISPAHGHAAAEQAAGHGQSEHDRSGHIATAATLPSMETHPVAHVGHHHGSGLAHYTSMHFLINDLFMVLFFGLAAKEITEACLPGGALNPVSKAINPLFGTLGGVLGPVLCFLLLNQVFGTAAWQRGWGIPTATDIALAWLVARFIFGKGHPAVSFLLLLAVADDAIGLGIIAIAYPDPAQPTVWSNALWILPGMAVAYALRRANVQNWIPYIVLGGALSWWGLFSAHLHPALALVFIVPFLPGPQRDFGLYTSRAASDHHHSALEQFEHHLKLVVDFGLFFFAFANAGVPLSGVNGLTWIVLASLVVGKTVGIFAMSYVGLRMGFALPEGMRLRHLAVAGSIAGIGLTVALFVSGQAFTDESLQGAAKMGALFSVIAPLAAVVLDRILIASSAASEWLLSALRLGRRATQRSS